MSLDDADTKEYETLPIAGTATTNPEPSGYQVVGGLHQCPSGTTAPPPASQPGQLRVILCTDLFPSSLTPYIYSLQRMPFYSTVVNVTSVGQELTSWF